MMWCMLLVSHFVYQMEDKDKLLAEMIQLGQDKDKKLQVLRDEILQGFKKESVFLQYRNQLTYQQGLIMYGRLVFIPKSLRTKMLTRIHQCHKDVVSVEAMQTIIYDYFSRYLEVVHMDRVTTDAVMKRLQNIFSKHGIPETVRNDEGTQFKSWDHITFSPKFPQSDGAAESAVAVAKNILMKSQDPNLGLLAYRDTPLESRFSLADLLFVVQTTLQPRWEYVMLQSIRKHDSYLKTRSKMAYDRRHDVKEFQPLAPGRVSVDTRPKKTGYNSRDRQVSQVILRVIRGSYVPDEESRNGVPVKATSIQGAADTAQPVASGEVRSMMAHPFDRDTPPRDKREESPFRGFPTDKREEAYNKAEEACSRTRRGRKIVPPQSLD
ncbi:hypothetical protein PR048_023091 [Dryococelus australis]|uniref:Integrase catalytic domain-containing protein n=1 Tax=Dryococelus australis TaxID=614101 RepID=A0ABQ9GT63_9NEOP|nr:hypothetical protein PR048_023091 [Dryococelus australis]